MNIKEFQLLLSQILAKHPYPPYERDDEGLVYLGFPENCNFSNKVEKYHFVYLMCLLITFDLKIYETHRQYYKLLKDHLNIPKFEYGLTNTFIFPEKIFSHYKIGFNLFEFMQCNEEFENYIRNKLIDNNINVDFDNLLDEIINDPDLNKGLWGKNYCEYLIQRKTNSLHTTNP